MRISLNITELGGYAGQRSRRAEGRGNPPHRRTHGVCGCPGGRASVKVSLPVNGRQCIQQYNQDSRLWELSPRYPICCEHHGSAISSRELSQSESGLRPTAREPGWGGLRVLALQPHVAGEWPSLLLQWVLHPKCLSSESSSHSRITRRGGGRGGACGWSLWCTSWASMFRIKNSLTLKVSKFTYMGRRCSSADSSWFKIKKNKKKRLVYILY